MKFGFIISDGRSLDGILMDVSIGIIEGDIYKHYDAQVSNYHK